MKNVQQISILLKPLAASLAVAGLVAFSLAGCDSANSKVPDAPAAGGPPVSTAAVIEKQITETQEFSGRLEAIERVEIRSRVGGFITSVNFKPGSEVKKGDVLFVIDPRPFQAEVSRAEGAAASARAKAELAKLELSRAEKLLAEKAIPQRELDEKASGLKELDANVRAAQASYEAARLNLSYTQVQAPISGRVSKAEITVGNLIDATAILTSVVSTDRIYASFDGDEDTYLRVAGTAQKGAPVLVKVGLANESGFPHEGKLEFVDNQLDPATGSVRMRATFANADRTAGARPVRPHPARYRQRRAGARHGAADQRPRRRHRPEPQVCVRGRRRQQGRIPRRQAGPERQRPARGARRPESGREDRRQRPAARAPWRPGDAATGGDGLRSDGASRSRKTGRKRRQGCRQRGTAKAASTSKE